MEQASILGLGAVTGYGWGMERLWAGLKSGRSAAKLHYDLGGAFPNPCWFSRVPDGGDPNIGFTRYIRAFVAAADEAIQDAKANGWQPGGRVGIVHATTRADLELMRARYLTPDAIKPRRAYVEQSWTTPSLLVMKAHGFNGPALVASAACSSGLHALAIAHRLLNAGDATDVIVVGADIGFDGEEMRLFSSLGPLIYDQPSEVVCRPFQEGTAGFVLGEGVGAIVLTTGASGDSYVSLLGSHIGNDHYHPVSIEPGHREIINLLDRSLVQANIAPDEVSYFSAHGTGTLECRDADTAVLDRLGTETIAYGTKPQLGHCMGAAPLLDTVILANAYRQRFLPVLPPAAKGHSKLASGPMEHSGGVTVQLGLGFGGNISIAVFSDEDSTML